jgi:chaperonin GroES
MAKKAAAGGIRIVPLGDRVVLKRAEAEEKTAGGILLPDAAKGKPQRGEVVSVGDGHVNDKGERVPLTVKEGDKVVFSSYAGDEITVGDETYLLMARRRHSRNSVVSGPPFRGGRHPVFAQSRTESSNGSR